MPTLGADPNDTSARDLAIANSPKLLRETSPDFAHAQVVTRPGALGGGPAGGTTVNNTGATHINVDVAGVKGAPGEVGSSVGKAVKDAIRDEHRRAMQHAQMATVGGA